jgi:hypothetical protein
LHLLSFCNFSQHIVVAVQLQKCCSTAALLCISHLPPCVMVTFWFANGILWMARVGVQYWSCAGQGMQCFKACACSPLSLSSWVYAADTCAPEVCRRTWRCCGSGGGSSPPPSPPCTFASRRGHPRLWRVALPLTVMHLMQQHNSRCQKLHRLSCKCADCHMAVLRGFSVWRLWFIRYVTQCCICTVPYFGSAMFPEIGYGHISPRGSVLLRARS